MVNGVAALHAKFEAVPTLIREEVVKAIEETAQQMVRDMRALAPKDTGALAASIQWTWGEAPKGSVTIASFKGKKFGRISATVYAGGDDAFYAMFQEFGTQKMTAQPFFFPAFRANRKTFDVKVRAAIRRAMKRTP